MALPAAVLRGGIGRVAAMAELDPIIATPDGPMRAILAMPEGTGPFAAAIMYPHSGGLTETMRMMARRAAEGGYLCVVPELYHRLGTIVLDPQSNEANAIAIRKIATESLTSASVIADTRALLDWLSAQPFVRKGRKGTIGYGRGGSFAMLAAGTFPGEIAAAASVLGFGFIGDKADSPHHAFAKAKAEFYCAFAEHDEIVPESVPRALAVCLGASPVEHRLVVHPGVRHPYAFPDRAVYDRAAAEADWDHIFALFAKRLRRD
jgi:carboxymethylenebutenolidase